MPKSILEVVEKAHSSKNQMSQKTKMQIVDAYGRALTMKKVIEDFIKVNRSLMIELGENENVNLIHGKDYTIQIADKVGAKLDNALIKEKLGDLEYHKCKVPSLYKTIQAMPLSDKVVARQRKDLSVDSIVDFKIAM
jgi:hypothetical protein|tara:strand:- start:1707 stop:2117 length:411 start_codon:yes stop_codon:yes gene_type:complete